MIAVESHTAITDVDSAAQRIIELLGTPLHVRATTAALESEGLRDVDADRIAPGCNDVFDLGRQVHARCLALRAESQPAPAGASVRRPQAAWKQLGRRYGRGLAYSLPMIAQGFALATLGVSLWGSAGLTSDEQTAIGLALVVSLIAVGPATHAMTRRLYYYYYQYDVRALERTAARWIAGAGAFAVILGGGAALALVAAGQWSSPAAAFCVYLALQPVMWAANAALFAIRRSIIASLAVLLPTVPVWYGLRIGLSPLPVHAAGLVAADVLLVAAALVCFRRGARTGASARRPLPRAALPGAVGGYAAWGLVYFLLIFLDRLVAWTGDGRIAFQPGYEAALQVALIPLLLVLPALEYVLARFGQLLRIATRRVDLDAASVGRRHAIRTMSRLVAGCLGAYALLGVGAWFGVHRLGDVLPLHVSQLITQPGTERAFVIALIAYGAFVVALGISSAYQLFARPWPMVAAGSLAVVADVVVGLIARSHGGPEMASLGLLAGGLVFMAGMAIVWGRHRRRVDYLWFAAS
jgi:hypothetical protein